MICANSRFELIWLSRERSKLKSISVKGVITREALQWWSKFIFALEFL